jgi:PAS domain S-box-containing protein
VPKWRLGGDVSRQPITPASEPAVARRVQQWTGGGGSSSGPDRVPETNLEPGVDRLQNGWRGVSAAVAASVVVAAAAAWAASLGSPLAAAAAVLALSAVVALAVVVRRNRPHPRRQPVAELRRELDRTRRDYGQLFSAVPCFICVLNRDHHVVEANALYREAFDVSDRRLCYEICKQRSAKCANCLVDQTFEDGQINSSEETLITREGRRINVVVHTRPVFDESGKIASVMEVFTDVTEVKRLQRQLALTGRAVAGMAHRVKNILMGLEGGIFIVNEALESDDRPSIDQGWEMVERNVGLVTGIVKDLLYCSKDRDPAFETEVCPQDIAREVRDLYAARMLDDNIEIRTELSEPPHRGTFDPDGIHSLLCNLVANAIDACRFDPCPDKPGHTVVIRCFGNGNGSTVFEVEDDGAGIPENLSHRVFQEYFSSKGSEGTGIGLLVVQKVAEEHGGKVTFESRPGRGTVFTVVIPNAHIETVHGAVTADPNEGHA